MIHPSAKRQNIQIQITMKKTTDLFVEETVVALISNPKQKENLLFLLETKVPFVSQSIFFILLKFVYSFSPSLQSPSEISINLAATLLFPEPALPVTMKYFGLFGSSFN